jgi:hypothetical protein
MSKTRIFRDVNELLNVRRPEITIDSKNSAMLAGFIPIEYSTIAAAARGIAEIATDLARGSLSQKVLDDEDGGSENPDAMEVISLTLAVYPLAPMSFNISSSEIRVSSKVTDKLEVVKLKDASFTPVNDRTDFSSVAAQSGQSRPPISIKSSFKCVWLLSASFNRIASIQNWFWNYNRLVNLLSHMVGALGYKPDNMIVIERIENHFRGFSIFYNAQVS